VFARLYPHQAQVKTLQSCQACQPLDRMSPWDIPGMTVSPQAEHCEEKALQ
jgi:hypothetical protein